MAQRTRNRIPVRRLAAGLALACALVVAAGGRPGLGPAVTLAGDAVREMQAGDIILSQARNALAYRPTVLLTRRYPPVARAADLRLIDPTAPHLWPAAAAGLCETRCERIVDGARLCHGNEEGEVVLRLDGSGLVTVSRLEEATDAPATPLPGLKATEAAACFPWAAPFLETLWWPGLPHLGGLHDIRLTGEVSLGSRPAWELWAQARPDWNWGVTPAAGAYRVRLWVDKATLLPLALAAAAPAAGGEWVAFVEAYGYRDAPDESSYLAEPAAAATYDGEGVGESDMSAGLDF